MFHFSPQFYWNFILCIHIPLYYWTPKVFINLFFSGYQINSCLRQLRLNKFLRKFVNWRKIFLKKLIIFQARSRTRARYVDEIVEEKISRWYVDACFINVPEVNLLPFVTSGSNGSNSGSSYTHKEPAFLKIYIFHHCRPFLHTLYR